MAEVELTRSALLAIREETLKAGSLETGGTLFGKETTDGEFLVTAATGPGPRHVATAIHYSTDHEYQIESIKEAEARGLQYLGEWHKHPSNFRKLSGGDIVTFFEIMKKNPQLDRILAMLTFLDDGDVNMGAYVLEKNGTIRLAEGIGGFQG